MFAKDPRSSPLRALGRIAGGLSRHWPLPRGRDRLAMMAAAMGGAPDPVLKVRSRKGHIVHIDPRNAFYRHAYFTGIYEPGITRLIECVVAAGDTCVDVGANIGWHSLIMAAAAGPGGRVYGFEPLPETYALLRRNVETNGLEARITTEARAVGAGSGTAVLSVPPGCSLAHATLSPSAVPEQGVTVAVVALDAYFANLKSAGPDVIKIDAEGAERMVIEGARQILSAARPPALIVEAAAQTSAGFGYGPNELLDLIGSGYRFYIIDEARGTLTGLDRFPPGHIGANILALPLARNDLAARLRRSNLLGGTG